MNHILSILGLLRKVLSWHPGLRSRSTFFVEPFITGAAVVIITVASAMKTLDTLIEAPVTQYRTNLLSDQLHNLPDKWKAETEKRYRSGKISGYEHQLLDRQAEQLRTHAEVAAYRLQQVGSSQANRLLASGGLQVLLTYTLAKGGDFLAGNVPANTQPADRSLSYLKRTFLAVKATVKAALKDAKGTLTKEGLKKIGKSKAGAVITSLDSLITKVISEKLMSPTVDVDDLYASKKRGLERLLTEQSSMAGDKLMAAHLANYILNLQQAKENSPERYAEKLKRISENLDEINNLSEAHQKLSENKIKSPWKTTKDFRQWLEAQVSAKQRADQEEKEKRLADISPKFSASPLQGKAPLLVRFDASASRGPIEEFTWEFGDEREGKGLVIEHIYQSKGEYTARLTASSLGGKTKSTSQKIVVSPGNAAVSVNLGVAPKELKTGENVKISVEATVTGLDKGQLKISVAVDGHRIGSESHDGSLEGKLSRNFQYVIPADMEEGDHVVQTAVQIRETPEDKWISAVKGDTFKVSRETEEKKLSGIEAFIGKWRGKMVVPTGDPDLGTLRVPFTLNISASGEGKIQVNSNSPHPAATPSSEIMTVKGNSAVMKKHFFESGMENIMTSKMTVVSEGKRIIGSANTQVYDPGPPREQVANVNSSFVAIKIE